MKTYKTLTIASCLLLLFTANKGNAQSDLMDPVSFKLKNGLTVIVAENKGTEKVYSSLTIETKDLPAEQVGVAEVLTAMLNESALKTAAGISFNENGGNLNTGAAEFNDAITALSSTVVRAALDTNDFERTKEALMTSIRLGNTSYTGEMTETEIENVTLKDVEAFYRSQYQPAKMCLAIAGNVHPSVAKLIVKKTFGDWKATANDTAAK